MPFSQEPAPPSVAVKWEDFDDEDVFRDTKEYAAAATCDNYVLEFGPNRARIVRNLQKDHFQSLLQEETRDTEYPIRWINIWDTSKYKDIVSLIGVKYAFSQRLISLMLYATRLQELGAGQSGKKKNNVTASKNGSAVQPGELERGVGSVEMSPITPVASSLPPLEGEEIELFLLLKDTVNYSSIDHTERALCIGAHWLYKRPKKPDQPIDDEEEFMPPKHFLWLVLCDDHTVITLHEHAKLEPMPSAKGWTNKDEWRRQQYKNMRANSLDVLLQQSKHGMALYEQRPLSQSSIRQALKKAVERSNLGHPGLSRVHSDVPPFGHFPGTTIEDEGTSNLFYYLFEDYSAAGPLKAASAILEKLTPLVLRSAERHSHVKSREIIKPLHMLSKDLRTLRHLFNNYMILIGKIIVATKRPGTASTLDPRASLNFRSDTNLSESLVSSDPERKVYLTTAALQRFDRLRDRLRGIMLNTIEGHFEEINALQDTYFNLTQQKDSSATARLTRSATLLAKLSVFFLPISFVTSYFSVQIEDLYLYWDARTYWYSFAVIATLSFLALTFFGKLLIFFSDVMDDWAEHLRLVFWKAVSKTGFIKVKEEDEED